MVNYLSIIPYDKYLDRAVKGNTLNKSKLDKLNIIIPPLEEQKRIAYVLSKIQNAIEIQDKLIKLLQELKKTMMHNLFTEGIGHAEFKDTEIGRMPKEWEIKRIKECATVKYGKSNPKTEGNIPLVGSGGVFGTVSVALIHTPTIVIGCKGTAGSVWDIRSPSWPSDTTFYLEYKTKILQKFLFEFMSLNKLTGESARTTLPSIKKEEIEELKFPFPPISEQEKIADILSTIDNKISIENKRKESFEKLLALHTFVWVKWIITSFSNE